MPTHASNPPELLYKYYPPKRIPYLLDGLIHFSSPSDFNDTFDSEYISASEERGARAKLNRSRMRSSLGVFCLTEDADNHLMWVNYADQHRGFIFGYRRTALMEWLNEENRTRFILKKVTYSTAAPILHGPDDSSFVAVVNKSLDWRYEKEWRCIKMFEAKESRDEFVGFGVVDEIIIGMKTEARDIASLLFYAERFRDGAEPPVRIYDAHSVIEDRSFEHKPSQKHLCANCGGDGYIRSE